MGGKMNGTIKDFRIWDAVKAPGDLNAEIDGTESVLEVELCNIHSGTDSFLREYALIQED